MLEIHPLTDEKELSDYLETHSLPEDAAVLRAYENGEVTGNISFSLAGRQQFIPDADHIRKVDIESQTLTVVHSAISIVQSASHVDY